MVDEDGLRRLCIGEVMAKMGKYCKAYHVKSLREFGGWKENTQNLRNESQLVDGQEMNTARRLMDDDILYLQENFIVTDGIFLDEHIIFDNSSPEWIEFCKNALRFEVPIYNDAEVNDDGVGV
jgi:hypothetical protein